MKLSADLREFIGLLNSHGVEFIIVGAHALAWHGLPRYTRDIDLFVHAEAVNAGEILRVLDRFGFGSLGLQAKDFLAPDQVIQLGREPNRIDLITGISGVDWDECWHSKVEGEMDGLPVFFLGRDACIKNKLASGRPQDLADVSRLKAIGAD
jgi:predicted nucleotidyltransferase